MSSNTFANLPSLLLRMTEKAPHRKNFFQKIKTNYVGTSHLSFCNQAYELAEQLRSLGIQKGDRVAIFSPNCPEWALADLAILSIGAVVVPLYPTLSAEETNYILADSDARLIFIRDTKQYQTLQDSKPSDSLQVLSFTPIKGLSCVQVDPNGAADAIPEAFKALLSRVSRDDLASIVYTSGTTGTPKGVELSHGNFLSNVEDLMQIFKIDENDSVLSFLPLSHVFERTVGYYTLLGFCSSVYYAESIDTISQNLMEVHPTILISVPRVYEKIQSRILERLNVVTRPIFNMAYSIGKRYQAQKKQGPIPFGLKLQHSIATLLVFRSVQKKTGGRLRFFVSGGAPLSQHLAEFFMTLGLLIIEGYGMTESAPIIACNREDAYQFGSVGMALPSVQARISDEGELCVKGPNVMKRYHKLPKETTEVIDQDGWLHTGDIATIESDGFIRIVDRKKEIIVMSNGKKVPPQKIEELLKTSRFISQVDVLGDNRNYLTALIVPEFSSLSQHLSSLGISDSDPKTLVSRSESNSSVMADIERLLVNCANYEKIKKIVLIAEPFSTENGDLTITLKLKRKKIAEKYAAEIDAMYAS